jgi:hypothetical protein
MLASILVSSSRGVPPWGGADTFPQVARSPTVTDNTLTGHSLTEPAPRGPRTTCHYALIHASWSYHTRHPISRAVLGAWFFVFALPPLPLLAEVFRGV